VGQVIDGEVLSCHAPTLLSKKCKCGRGWGLSCAVGSVEPLS
jgi:hypothetical protein